MNSQSVILLESGISVNADVMQEMNNDFYGEWDIDGPLSFSNAAAQLHTLPYHSESRLVPLDKFLIVHGTICTFDDSPSYALHN